MRNQPSLQRLIPVTALRHFYRLLRRFESKAFHLQAAKECLRRPDQLTKLAIESREHFTHYDNRDEAFHDRGGVTDARLSSGHMANVLVQQIASSDATVESAPQFDFTFVDYEISPIRTTKTVFETGEPAQRGRGGIDLLLSNRGDRTPIVAEGKADTDRNPFLGLIQSLNYAVELSTEPQRKRLDQFYSNRFAWSTEGPWIDIYLILLNYPQDKMSQDFLDLTDQISASLMAANNPVSGIIRRIVALKNPMSTTSLNSFTVAFAHGHQSVA